MKQKFLLKSMLLLFAMIVGTSSAWADVVSGTTYNTLATSSLPTGWTGSDGGGTSYIKLTAAENYIQTSNFVQNGFTSIKVKARKFGGPSDAQALITVSWYDASTSAETVLGTVAPSSTSLTDYTISSPTNPTGNTTGYIKIQCKGAGSGKGSGVSQVTITYTKGTATPAYTITAQSNNENYGTVSLEGSVITGSPKSGCRYATPAYTIDPENSATVAQNGNAFTVTPSANTTVTINFEPIPTHTATFSVNGVTSTQDFAEGAAITFPSNPADIYDKKFVGWVATAIDGTTNEVPSFVTSATMGEADVTYYAVFASVGGESGWIETALANMTASDIFVFSNGSYALTNDNGTSNAPEASSITVESSKITSNVADNLKWNVSGNATDGYVFYPNGSTTTWLYCNTSASSGSNNNIRVGTGDRKVWIFDNSGYLVTNDDKTGRYLSLYNNSDFRGYINTENGAFVPKFYKYSSGTISDYCTTVVAAAVEKPVITLGANPFLFSTTATITCATEGATIKYSYDGENWNDYTSALTITETKTIYAKAIKGNDESSVAQVTATKNLAEPTVTISGNLTLDLNGQTNVEAGTLTAAVTYNEEAISGAVVTWSSNNEDIATVNATTGAVTIKTTGEVTFTATYVGNSDYAEATGTKTITVIDTNAPGTENNPYTVAAAIAYINTLGSATSANDVYVSGIVSQVDSYNDKYYSITYWISDDGSTTGQMEVYSGKGLNGADFSAVTDLAVGDVVTVKGKVKKYSGTPEFTQNNELVSFNRPVIPSITLAQYEYNLNANGGDAELPVTCSNLADNPQLAVAFVESDGETAATYDWISASINANGNIDGHIDVNTGDARTAYFIVTGVDAGNNVIKSNLITINQAAPAAPSITVEKSSIDIAYGGESDRKLSFEYESLGSNPTFEVSFFEQDGTTPSTYDWITTATIENNKVNLSVEANDGEARTAYFKVHAVGTEVYSNLVTINQAEFVIDYATLPFVWEGGTSSALTALTGITVNGLGSDYGDNNSPYYVKFDNTGDYIQIKLNEQPGVVTIGVKMIGGSDASDIIVQGSSDGDSFSDVETLEISGSQNSVVNLTTTKAFAATDRFVRLSFNKGSNVGVGPISIAKAPAPEAPVWSTLPTPTVNLNEIYELDLSNYVTGYPAPTITLKSSTADVNDYTFDDGELTFQTANAGEYDFTFTATNSEGSVDATLTITASGVPEISVPQTSYSTELGGADVEFTVTATGTPAPTLALSNTTAKSDDYDFDPNDGFFTFTPSATGTFTFTFTATNSAGSVSKTVTVNVALQAATIPDFANANIAYGSTYTVDDSGIEGGEITVTSGNASIATVNGLEITPVAVGTTTITVATVENATYAAGSKTFELTVTAPEGLTMINPVLDFTTNTWGLPTANSTTTATYSNGKYSVEIYAPTNYRFMNNCLFLGKEGAKLTLPAFAHSVTQIDVVGTSGASTNVKQNIYVGNVAVSTETTGAKDVTNNYVIDSEYQASGTIYTLKVNSAANTQISKIIVHQDYIPTVTAKLNAYGYGTFCSEYPLDFSSASDYSAWQITGTSGTEITFEKITGTVKGGTGIFLMGEANATVSLTATDSEEELASNKLVGTLAPTYVVTNEAFGLSGNTFVKVNEGTVPAGKALLPASVVGNASRLTFEFKDNTTGISTIKHVTLGEDKIFDMQGRRVEKPSKGMYIMNGKKVIVK